MSGGEEDFVYMKTNTTFTKTKSFLNRNNSTNSVELLSQNAIIQSYMGILSVEFPSILT